MTRQVHIVPAQRQNLPRPHTGVCKQLDNAQQICPLVRRLPRRHVRNDPLPLSNRQGTRDMPWRPLQFRFLSRVHGPQSHPTILCKLKRPEHRRAALTTHRRADHRHPPQPLMHQVFRDLTQRVVTDGRVLPAGIVTPQDRHGVLVPVDGLRSHRGIGIIDGCPQVGNHPLDQLRHGRVPAQCVAGLPYETDAGFRFRDELFFRFRSGVRHGLDLYDATSAGLDPHPP